MTFPLVHPRIYVELARVPGVLTTKSVLFHHISELYDSKVAGRQAVIRVFSQLFNYFWPTGSWQKNAGS